MVNFVIVAATLSAVAGLAFAGNLIWRVVTSSTIEEHQCVIGLLSAALTLVASMVTLGSVFAQVVGK